MVMNCDLLNDDEGANEVEQIEKKHRHFDVRLKKKLSTMKVCFFSKKRQLQNTPAHAVFYY